MLEFTAGDYFFHYTTREAAFEHIIPTRALRLSPYARMRDPLEAEAPELGAAMTVPTDRRELERLNTTYLQARDLIGRRRAEAKLLSLTIDATTSAAPEAAFDRGYARARMWEQYAEAHHGVCLVFDRDALGGLVEQQITGRAGIAIAGPVRYSKTALVGTGAATLLPRAGVDAEQLATEHLQRHADVFFLLKLVDWESEHEFRFVEPTPGEEYRFVDFGESLRAVLLGAKFPPWQIYGAIEVCKPLDVELWQMAWQLNRPLPSRARLPNGDIVDPDGTIRPPAVGKPD